MAVFARSLLALSLPLLLSACSGSGTSSESSTSGIGSNRDGIALFSVSGGSATPDQIFGVWEFPSVEGDTTTIDARTRLAPGSDELATRCTYAGTQVGLVADVNASARISNSEIDVLEAKTDVRMQDVNGRTLRCTAATNVASAAKCDASSGQNRSCFVLSGRALTVYDDQGSSQTATKISD